MFNIFCIICIFFALYIFFSSGSAIKSISFTLFSGFCSLLVLYFASANGAAIAAFTPITLTAGAFFGIPGVIGVLILRLIGIF
ncbi:MAG: hypothetical protein RR806_00970 [Oscillospiraceae bacterium]